MADRAESPTASSAAGTLLTVVYDSGMDDRITETLAELGVDGWTKVFRAHGLGGAGHKQDTPIWPGTVNLLYIALSESEAGRVASALRTLQRSYRRNPGLTMWTQRVVLL